MNSIGKIAAFFMSLIVFFILPIFYQSQKQDSIIQTYVQMKTQAFVDSIRVNGYINEEMYFEFIDLLDATGNLYTVGMDHSHMITEPYVEEDGSINGFYEYSSNSYEEEIKEAIFKTDGVYHLSEGDFISVTVRNRSNTYGDALGRMIYGSKPEEYSIFATAGGRIRDEAA